MRPLVILQLLVLLTLANGAPVVAKKLLGDRFAAPVDLGATFADGRPLFGRSKTWRGLLLAILAATVGAPPVGLDWMIGLLVGCLAMAGDLASSFLKRRLARPPSSRALGIDQIPESLLPLVACAPLLGLSLGEIAVVLLVFFVGEILLSRLLYRLRLRDEPY